MAVQKILVRSRATGQLAEIGVRSWPLFAGFYDRVDIPVPAEAVASSPVESPATETPDPTPRRAAKTPKE